MSYLPDEQRERRQKELRENNNKKNMRQKAPTLINASLLNKTGKTMYNRGTMNCLDKKQRSFNYLKMFRAIVFIEMILQYGQKKLLLHIVASDIKTKHYSFHFKYLLY